MISNEFKFLICSPVDREELTCEIYYKNEICAEISQETDEFILEIYPTQTNKWWTFHLNDFQQALEYAKNHLLSG